MKNENSNLPESVNATVLNGLRESLRKGKTPEELLEELLSPKLDEPEQRVASMATWDYLVSLFSKKKDKRFTKEKLEAMNKRISEVLDE